MDYEKKYKELVGQIKKVYLFAQTDSTKAVLESILPELKESEDERVRKDIRQCIKLCSFVPSNGTSKDEMFAWLEKQGEQKPVDKTEPKFHEGDWIISNDKKSTYQVTEVKRGIYVIRDNADGHEYYIGIEECEKSGRLWNIGDAKDGDVLATNSWLYLFKYTNNKAIIQFHCTCPINGKPYKWCFSPDYSYLDIYIDVNIHPATKEQCDLMFQKMEEEGYEWDAEKKELKKIEFNPDDLIEESYQQQADDLIDMVTEKSAWSEEDIFKVQRICKYLNEAKKYYADITEIRDCIDWLKSIEDRVQPQPKQDWSKEDEYNLQCFIAKADKDIQNGNVGRNQELIDWIKSIKDRVQPQQKPK